MKNNGIVIRLSNYNVKETVDRLQQLITKNGATIYTRIDQQAELKKVGTAINALEYILFGNPRAGGALMLQNPLTALDLPLKMISWEDEQHQVWVAYNNAEYIQGRYELKADPHSPLNLDNLVKKALNLPD